MNKDELGKLNRRSPASMLWDAGIGFDGSPLPGRETSQQQPCKKASKIPAWVLWLRCVLVRGGHSYGRWWWTDREEAHCLCEECADMRTPKNRHEWLHRERGITIKTIEAHGLTYLGEDMVNHHYEEALRRENAALRQMIRSLGFDADKVVEQLTDDTNHVCKNLSLGGLRVVRDFTGSTFTPAGVSAANKWLDSLQS